MDEDPGVKAPVTRLRRRLSVETEGTQSPSTPSTPTKKRASRLAKPALELIDENATENMPKRSSRRSVAKEAIEPVEEKTVTPSRRNTRLRSNTSIVAENTVSVGSPRAVRAARRNSQLGSDTETATTPVRQTRRTRRDSTSSVEKLVTANLSEKTTAPVADAIIEEPEKEVIKETQPNITPSQTLRKSPRLNKNEGKQVNEENTANQQQKSVDISNTQAVDTDTNKEATLDTAEKEIKLVINKIEKENQSNLSSSNLINGIESNPKVSSVLNKTTSAIVEEKNDEKSNRKRTKSWTTVTNKMTEGKNIYDKVDDKEKNQNFGGSGDFITIVNEEIKNDKTSSPFIKKSISHFDSSAENKENILYMKSEGVMNATETAEVLQRTPSINMQSVILMEDSDSNTGSLGKLNIDIQNDRDDHNDAEDQCVPVVKRHTPKRTQSESFICEPMDIDETIPPNVTITDFSDKTDSSREENTLDNPRRKSSQSNENDDSETNKSKLNSSMSRHQINSSKRKSSVGVSENNDSASAFNKSGKPSLNNGNNISLSETANKSKRKSSVSIQQEFNSSNRKSYLGDAGVDKDSEATVHESSNINENSNKFKNSSLVSETENQKEIEKTSNENKSTLVLSQLKVSSLNDTGNVSKSPNDTSSELSKSVIPEVSKEEKKNLSMSNYLTSTPLQQKPLQKIALNSSIISTDSKKNSKVEPTPEKRLSKLKPVSDSLDDESRKHSMIIDEAEEAGGDYESGDSRDDDERQYEEENEIAEKGITLESERDFSNDSDYEKDSFIVSSDEEDEELLSGSGDDLSLSDNELKMTAKSKKKFNERKVKEQKKASREMYEARHKINKSDDMSLKKKKSKKQQVNSSSSESDDNEAQLKKSKRLKIDSSQELSLNISDEDVQPKKKKRLRIDSNSDISLNKSDGKKKKTKRLSESVLEENACSNENEITIYNKSASGKNDPLLVTIKDEPKTPQKNLDISTVIIHNNIEEVQLNMSLADKSNNTTMKQNETSDPLQATIYQDEDSVSDISENMEIKQNYDSILENLNKSNKHKQVKTLDTSLNFNKKTKKKGNNPIMDQLNLTQTKIFKKNKGRATENKEEIEKSNTASTPNDDGDTSDSIDMKLLFPDDSNDSEVNASKFIPNENKIPEVTPEEEFIPLKKSIAKTNIRESLSLNMSEFTTELNDSKIGKKNRKSSQSIVNDELGRDDPNNTNVSFFIDTKGTYAETDTSIQTSAKKNKKKKAKDKNETLTGNEDVTANQNSENQEKVTEFEDTITSERPLEVSFKSDKKKKNKHKDTSVHDEPNVDQNVSMSGKKNPKISVTTVEDNIGNFQDTTFTEFPLEMSFKSDKKKKKKHSVSFSDDQIVEVFHRGEKRTCKLSESVSDDNKIISETENINKDTSLSASPKKKKMNKNINHSISEEPASEASVKNNSICGIAEVKETSAETAEETPLNDSVKKDKKKKKKNKSFETPQTVVENTAEELDEAPVEVSYKNTRPNLSASEDAPNDTDAAFSGKKNKKKKNINSSLPLDQPAQEDANSNKRKRKINENVVNTDEIIPDAIAESKQKKKKLKISQDGDAPNEEKIMYSSHENVRVNDEVLPPKMSKKNKKSKHQDIPGEPEKTEAPQHKSKKRKAEDDGTQKMSKVLKEYSLDDIHVPRLPESIVQQLEDKPSRGKKKKAISTTEFEVEVAKIRNSKPSTYLEESVYLNDSPVKKKPKSSFKKPKVLPFTPTVIASDQGFTTNFKINLLPKETEFVAQASDMPNFKNDYLSKQRTKKLGTYDLYRRNYKISKF